MPSESQQENRYRDERGRKIPLDVVEHFGFDAEAGAQLGNYCMALCGMARSLFWPVKGKFNGREIVAYESSSVESLVCDYWTLTAAEREKGGTHV